MDADTEKVRRRLERERVARREAEAIAERVTGELYASKGELQRANEELQSLNQTLRDFVAVASHDLRGPLTSILGASSLMSARYDELADRRRHELLDMIQRQGQHLARMIEDLLTVSKIEAGQLDIAAEVVKLRAAIELTINDFGESAEQVHIDCDDIETMVDPEHLHRMLMNYLGNAFKYGQPPVDISAHANGEWVEIHVCDRGDGVPDELIPRLFGKFARGPEARDKGGSGLGLSIVQGLARANGGETWYQPNLPKGSCFVLRLPKRAA